MKKTDIPNIRPHDEKEPAAGLDDIFGLTEKDFDEPADEAAGANEDGESGGDADGTGSILRDIFGDDLPYDCIVDCVSADDADGLKETKD